MFTRRTVQKFFVAGAASELLGGQRPLTAAHPTIRRFRIWDIHSHLHSVPGDTPEAHIERLSLSQGYPADLHPTPDQLSEENNRVMRAVRHFPESALGSVYLSPSFLDFSLQEFDRCVRDGPMVGIGELEADTRCRFCNKPGSNWTAIERTNL